MRSGYTFRKVALSDLALLRSWQSHPHVREWWDTDEPYSEQDLADSRVARRIVSQDARPFAFMQDYTVHGWDDHHFAHLPKGARGIDQYIGDPAMLGQGHGTAFIRQRIQTLFDQGAPMIATDPHPRNARAIAVYTTLGFTPIGPEQVTPWGLILPMVARR
ncbi:GNAT family N-acetyltransferase [Yoonia sp.]|uniref:GNAT family N-acetyltransferase n=1 Tax=Yoonia sp. TaxID=2212373 RepID=UPI00391C7D8E